jgi:hypothetical protein
LRATNRDNDPAYVVDSRVGTALTLALADPPAAAQILRSVEANANLIGTGGSGSVHRQHWLMAWALADPKQAKALFEKELAALKKDPQAKLEDSGLVEMAEILTIAPPDRPRHVLRFFGNRWFPGDE